MNKKSKENFLQVRGGKIWYQVLGADIQATPLVVVHGGPGYPSYYLQNLSKLALARPVVFYDQLGCGRSDWPKDTSFWNVSYFVDELNRLTNHLGFKSVNILGHSWGSFLAVSYAAKYHNKINSLILASPFISTKLWAATMFRYLDRLPNNLGTIIRKSESEGKIKSREYKKAVREFHTRHEVRLPRDPYIKRLSDKHFNDRIYKFMWGSNEYTISGTLKNADLTQKLKKLKTPVLFTCGKYEASDPKSVKKYVDLTPNAQMEVFTKSAHMPHIKEEKKYLKIVMNF